PVPLRQVGPFLSVRRHQPGIRGLQDRRDHQAGVANGLSRLVLPSAGADGAMPTRCVEEQAMNPSWISPRVTRCLAALRPLALIAGAQAKEGDQAPQWRNGKEVYDKVCGLCHKPSVGVGTVLEGRELPVEYLKFIVRNGLNAMPAFPDSHVDDQS